MSDSGVQSGEFLLYGTGDGKIVSNAGLLPILCG